jgi:signal transduction histidine kinase
MVDKKEVSDKVRRNAPIQLFEHLRHDVAEGLLLIDENNVIQSANLAAEALLGYGPGQLTSLSFDNLWPVDRPQPAVRLDKAGVYEASLRQTTGGTIPVSLAVSTPFAAPRQGEKLVSIIGQERLDRLSDALLHTQRLAGIGTLTASVTHELTNPISIITATCSNLQDEMRDGEISPEQLARYLDLIEQSAFRCARIVEVLRNYAHNDGPTIAVTNPQAIVQDALVMVEQHFRKRANVRVESEIDPNLRTIVCDHNRVTQVLINLLTNARDAMQPGGGTIGVHFWLLEDPMEGVGSTESGGVAVSEANGGNHKQFAFSVRDSGHGMTPEVMERLFDPFFTTKPNGQGTGLGLFIAQGIVAQHHGRLWAENNPDGGATFTVVLPCRQ